MSKIITGVLICFFLAASNFTIVKYVHADEPKPIKLSAPQLGKGKSLMQALNERRSTRAFSSKELPHEVLSNLLWAAFGINRPDLGKRTAPSAMNFQEIEIYVAMKKGLYLYNPAESVLEPIIAKDIREFVGKQEFTQAAPVNLIYVADFSKMKGEDESKVFYSAIDTGFISQNVYLFCASEGLATVVIGWVEKDKLADMMDLTENKKIIVAQPVGYPKK